jgi:RNA methyltransferase, TrmH family
VFPADKLSRLPPGQALRKAAKLLEFLERALRGDIAALPESGLGSNAAERAAALGRIAAIARALLAHKESGALGPLLEESLTGTARACGDSAEADPLRVANRLREDILQRLGVARADWDFLDSILPGEIGPSERLVMPGAVAYLEDIRSPFNVGSIFRSAESLGLESLALSPRCADPLSARSARSARGCVERLPWSRLSLADLPKNAPVFALETGGVPVDEFDFPAGGIALVGSEELGLSPEALKLAESSLGRVTVPMAGSKASLNVGVAFGILAHRWMEAWARTGGA